MSPILLVLLVIFVSSLGVWLPLFSLMKTNGRQSVMEFALGGFLISLGVDLYGALLWHPILYLIRVDQHPEMFVALIYAVFGAASGVLYRLLFFRSS